MKMKTTGGMFDSGEKSTHAYETQDAIEVLETVKEELPEWLDYVYKMKDDLIKK